MSEKINVLLAVKDILLQYECDIRKLMEYSYIINFNDVENAISVQKERFQKLLEYYDEGKANVVLAFVNGAFAGYAWFFQISQDRVHLNEIAVVKEFHSKGIGRQLIEFVEIYAKEHHISKVELYCMEVNDQANRFYNRNGYKTEKRLFVKDI